MRDAVRASEVVFRVDVARVLVARLQQEQARALVERGDDVELLGRGYATVRRTVATSPGRPCSENEDF